MLNDNNAVISNNYERNKDLILFLKFSMVMRKDFFSKFIDNLDTRPQKVSPPLT